MEQNKKSNPKKDKYEALIRNLDNDTISLKNTLKNPYVKAVAFIAIGYGVLVGSKYVFNALADMIIAGKRLRKAVQQ